MLKASIISLDKSMEDVTRGQPKLCNFISDLEKEREKKREDIQALEMEIYGLYKQEDEKKQLCDINR